MSGNESKKHAASKRKLQKQRNEGSIASSSESSSMLATAFGIALSCAIAPTIWMILQHFIIEVTEYISLPFSDISGLVFTRLVNTLYQSLAIIVGSVVLIGTLSTVISNNGIVFATKPITPDLKRISIVSGFKRIFGKRGMIESLVAGIRLAIWLLVSISIGLYFLPNLFISTSCGTLCHLTLSQKLMLYLVYSTIVLLLAFAIVDIVVQRTIFLADQKMTDTERKRERKDQSSSPEVAQERSRRRELLAISPEVPLREEDSTILFWGEKGYIGINYDPPKQPVPLICAKARYGKKANELRKRMVAQGVPIMESGSIVADCMGKGLEENLSPSQFRAFARALATR